jgi:hypothetical protein
MDQLQSYTFFFFISLFQLGGNKKGENITQHCLLMSERKNEWVVAGF